MPNQPSVLIFKVLRIALCIQENALELLDGWGQSNCSIECLALAFGSSEPVDHVC